MLRLWRRETQTADIPRTISVGKKELADESSKSAFLTITAPYCFVISLRSTAAYCNAGMVYLGFKCKCSLERSTNIYLEGGGGGGGSGQQTLLRRFSPIPPPSPTVYFKPSRPPNESSISTTILRIKMGGCKQSTQSRVKAVLLYYAKFFRFSRTVIIFL